MSRLLAAELYKLRSTRMVYGLLVATVALAVLSVAATIATANLDGGFELGSPQATRNVFSSAGAGNVLVLVLGIMIVTGEYRHGTITATFLMAPRRERVVEAKLLLGALVGLGFAVVAAVVTVVVAVPWMSARGVDVSLAERDAWLPLLGGVLSTTIYGVVGVGVGALARNQVAAVVGALAWLLVIENIIVALATDVGRWLPGAAAAAVAGAALPDSDLLPWWLGGIVLIAYGLAFAALGSRFVVNRDIT